MKPFFITGTGTDIGKTFVTAGIVQKFIEAEYKTALVKPVQTGTDDYPTDVDTVKSMVNGLFPLTPEQSVPFHFKVAASPHLSAEVENRYLPMSDVVAKCRELEKIEGLDVMFFEGAGGLIVPLNNEHHMLDLIVALGYPAVVVTDALLGAINHCILSVMAMRAAGAKIAGIVINNMPNESDLIAEDNVKVIKRLSGLPILAVVNRCEGKVTGDVLGKAFAELDIDTMMKA